MKGEKLSSTEDNNFDEEGRSWRHRAYVKETEEVPRLLYELCRTLESPPHDSRGPKPLPLGDKIQCMVLKVFFCRSAARTVKLLEPAQKMGRISRTPKANSLLYYFDEIELTPVLHDLIGRSARPLISHERWFAFDGTAFQMRDYLDYTGTYTADRANGHRYITLHTIAGVNTKIVPAAAVDVCLEQYFHMTHDSQFVEDLLKRTVALGFTITDVWGDKAYHSARNQQLIKDIGAWNHVTPRRKKGEKRGAAGEAVGPDPQMRVRNGVETVYSMMKQIFGPSVASRKRTSLINEALCIVLAHNLRALFHFSLRQNIEIKFEKYPDPE